MQDVLAQLLVLVPIFLFSPPMYAAMIVVLGSPTRPATRGASVLLGSAITVLILGFLGATIVDVVAHGPQMSSTISGLMHLGFGALIVALALVLVFHPKFRHNRERQRTDAQEKVPRKASLAKDAGLGVLLTVTNPTSLGAYLAISEITAHADIAPAERFTAMALAGFLYVTPILWPVLVALMAPGSTAGVLGGLNHWIMTWGRWIMVAILLYLAFGVFRNALSEFI